MAEVGSNAVPKVNGARRCILCGKPASWRPVLLVVPHRGYTGNPWRMQVGVAVCGACRHPMPQELLEMVNRLTDLAKQPRLWDYICEQVALKGMPKPHHPSTRVDYVNIDGPEARGHDEASGRPGPPASHLNHER